MDLSTLGNLGLIVLLILVNAFFAAAEIAIVSVRKARLRQIAEQERRPGGQAALRLAEEPSRFLATIQIGVTLSGFFASAVGALSAVELVRSLLSQVRIPLVANASGPIALVAVTVAIAFFTLIFGELVPKNLALRNAESVALAVARPIEWLSILSAPVVFILTSTTNLALAALGIKARVHLPSVTEEEIRSVIEAGEEEGVVEPEEREMVEGVFELEETRVHEVMVPRIDMVMLEKGTPLDEALRVFLETGYSRLPVYEESRDNVVGTLYAKDLLRHFGGVVRAENIDVLLRPAVFVPESKRVGELLRELQRSNTQLAVVVDEYGGTAGLVTMEDLLEEIVGEIHDEYDTVERRIELLGPGEAMVSGKAALDELNDALDLDLKGEGYDTVAGLIYSHLGRIPNPGDQVQVDGALMTVVSIVGRRIRQVRVQRREPPPGPEGEGAPDDHST